MRTLVAVLAAVMTLAGGFVAQSGPQASDKSAAATPARPHARGKPVRNPTKGKRIKTTIPPGKAKKG
jgi:hypothetical protein